MSHGTMPLLQAPLGQQVTFTTEAATLARECRNILRLILKRCACNSVGGCKTQPAVLCLALQPVGLKLSLAHLHVD